jgi:hypothetical protein
MQFAENKFTENYLTTIGVDFRYQYNYPGLKLSSRMVVLSSSRSGILQARRDSELSHLLIIRVQTGSSWSTI